MKRDELVDVAANILATIIFARSGSQNKSPVWLYGTKPGQGKESRQEVIDLSIQFAEELIASVDRKIAK